MAPKKAIVGIDIGTTYSTVGIWTGNAIRTVTIPSSVAFTDHNEPMIGDEAIEQLDTNVPNTIVDARRLIGGSYSDIDVGEDLIRILIRLTQIAEKELGTKEVVTDAVICVPSFFNNSQRIATMDAARMAGVNVLRLITETSATALAYRWSDESCCKKRQEEDSSESRSDLMKKEEDVLVFDIGSGSLSVSVIKIKPGWKEFEVKAVAGHTHLGGNDMDAALAASCVQEFTKFHPNGQQPEEIVISNKSRNTLRSECELARMVLCSPDNKLARTTVNVKSFDGTFPMIDSLNEELFNVCREEVQQCLQDSQISQVHQVILVGGCSGMPRIRQMLGDLCKVKEFCEFEKPRSVVAQGATILAASLSGAAVHGLQVSEITPFSIGVKCADMSLRNFIPKHTNIPSERRDFETSVDSQGILKFGVYEGENEVVEENNLLGYFVFREIHSNYILCGDVAALTRRPTITVRLYVDQDGILCVSAAAGGGRIRPKMYTRKVSCEDNDGQEEEEIKRKQLTKTRLQLYVTNMEGEMPDEYTHSVFLLNEHAYDSESDGESELESPSNLTGFIRDQGYLGGKSRQPQRAREQIITRRETHKKKWNRKRGQNKEMAFWGKQAHLE